MPEFVVSLTACAPDGASADPRGYADSLTAASSAYAGTVGASAAGWTLKITLQAADLPAALSQAAGLLPDMLRQAQAPDWPLCDVRGTVPAVLAAGLQRTALPVLVSAPEAAVILGVSPQRLHKLAESNPDFPRPLYRLASGFLWDRLAIVAFSGKWQRKPGRPRKGSTQGSG